MNEICENFRYACGIPTVKCGVYEGKCRTCLYWPPDAEEKSTINLFKFLQELESFSLTLSSSSHLCQIG
jgi:hypothetical protein